MSRPFQTQPFQSESSQTYPGLSRLLRSDCEQNQVRFSAYLDGALTGVEMLALRRHLDACPECTKNFAEWRSMQQNLAELGPMRPPADLALRLRVAISQERARTTKYAFARFAVRWQNTFAPFMLRASAGFASTVLLIGTALLLIGTFAAPEPLTARDEPGSTATAPKLLYSMLPFGGYESNPPESSIDGSVVVRAFVDNAGRVYDFCVLSGASDAATHAELENKLLYSVFEPARVFGQAVPGTVVLAFAGVSVQG